MSLAYSLKEMDALEENAESIQTDILLKKKELTGLRKKDEKLRVDLKKQRDRVVELEQRLVLWEDRHTQILKLKRLERLNRWLTGATAVLGVVVVVLLSPIVQSAT